MSLAYIFEYHRLTIPIPHRLGLTEPGCIPLCISANGSFLHRSGSQGVLEIPMDQRRIDNRQQVFDVLPNHKEHCVQRNEAVR